MNSIERRVARKHGLTPEKGSGRYPDLKGRIRRVLGLTRRQETVTPQGTISIEQHPPYPPRSGWDGQTKPNGAFSGESLF